jgi:hypothetical protein
MWPLGDFYFTSAKSSLRNAQRPTPMREIFWLTITTACCALFLTAAVTNADLRHDSLKSPDDFANIKDDNERSVALFEEAGKVILPLLGFSGHYGRADPCPLLGVKRTLIGRCSDVCF